MPLRWEVASDCGACGSERHTGAGEVCGRRFVRCAGCGVVRLLDRVAAADLGRLYQGYYDETAFGADRPAVEAVNPTFVHRCQRLEQALGHGERRIFEVGAGDGNFLAYLKGSGWRVAGSEFDAGTAEVVRRRHEISLFVGDVVRGHPHGCPYPVVAAYHVLEHVYQPAAWLDAVGRMIAADGILHLQVPNYGSLSRRVAGMAWPSVMFPQHVYFYTPSTLSALLERHGFSPLSVTTWDPWHGPGSVSGTVVNTIRHRAGGQLPWTAEPAVSRASAAAPASRRPRLSRRVLDAASGPLSRLEAAVGMGAVVDVIARRSPIAQG